MDEGLCAELPMGTLGCCVLSAITTPNQVYFGTAAGNGQLRGVRDLPCVLEVSLHYFLHPAPQGNQDVVAVISIKFAVCGLESYVHTSVQDTVPNPEFTEPQKQP